eukprot:NODE_121_length_18880_cov_0.205687.p1 type:complete len:749 gc:universal NODE_121_length_18880_cov_0.205687:5520-7766(+)
MKILVLGNGGREDAICQALKNHTVYCSPGNGNTNSVHGNPIEFAISNKVELVIVGPEQPLVDGICEQFRNVGIYCFGPSQLAAQIEGSKAYCKDFMRKYDIPTARYKVFADFDAAKQHIELIEYDVVLKTSGLAAGKGVLLPKSKAEAIEGLKSMMVDKKFGSAGECVVIEELLSGPEVSVLAFSDGYSTKLLPPAQDHKRAYNDDQGPNTGGMGAYCPTPVISEEQLEFVHKEIIQKAIDGMRAEHHPYVGIIYAGIMLTSSGPMNLEFNCRFGDPECQVILPLLETDLADILIACCKGYLDSIQIIYRSSKSLGVVLASGGYPFEYTKGCAITLPKSSDPNIHVYHAGTLKLENGNFITNGGRVLCVVGVAETFAECKSLAYNTIKTIFFDNMMYRTDIGSMALDSKKTQSLTYASSGVDIQAGNDFISDIKAHVKSTSRPGSNCDIGGFGALFDLTMAGYPSDAYLVCCTDGVGTKLKLAVESNILDTVGIDLVAMSVNDLVVQGAEPLLFLDYYACGYLNREVATKVVSGIAKGCVISKCALIGGETAEMPGMYYRDDFDLAGFAVGAVMKNNVYPKLDNMRPGNVLLGLKSSGIHSNGFSLVRKILKINKIKLNDKYPIDEAYTVAQVLMEPTRIYTNEVLEMTRSNKNNKILGFAHITGGGLIENVPRVLPNHLEAVYHNLALNPLFKWIQNMGNVEMEEMRKTFNCGYGLVVIVDTEIKSDIIERFEAVELGYLVEKKVNK